jgi:uncharacterized protein with FMN-binding domain
VRRAPVVIVSTAAGLVALLSFHAHRPRGSDSLATVAPAGAAPASGAAGSAASAATTPAPSTSSTAPGRGTPASSAPATAAPATSAPGPRRADGTLSRYPYGQLEVQVTADGSRISDVELVTISETDTRSLLIDQDAIPQLKQQVLQAQSAHIDGVSGATFTSQAYAHSVQSALDRLGIK